MENEINTFGFTDVFLDGETDSVRSEETNLGNLTADADLFTAQQFDDTVLVSFKNGGTINSSIGEIDDDGNELPPEEGKISESDITNSLSFNNPLTLLTVTAEELVNIVEYGVADNPDDDGRFPQVSGLNFSFDPDAESIELDENGDVITSGERVQSLAIVDDEDNIIDIVVRDGEIVGDAERDIRLVTLDFLAGGGDGYPFEAYGEDVVDLQDALQVSVDDPIINFIPDRGFVLQDTDFGTEDIFTLFDLDIQGDITVVEETLGINEVNLLVSPEFAAALGDEGLTGADLGDAQVDGTLTPDGENFIVNGGTTSVNLDFELLESLGLGLFEITGTGTPDDGFAVGFPIVGEGDDTPFVFSTENGLTPISGDIDHEGRVVLEPIGSANFAASGTEQDALAEFLSTNFGTEETAFDEAETSPEEDNRIQNLSAREDGVFDSISPEALLTEELFRVRTGDGTYVYVGEEELENIKNSDLGFTDEGLAFNVSFTENDQLIPIYRFRNDNLPGAYLYVAEEERQSINESGDLGFTEEGLAFYTFGADAGETDSISRLQTVPGAYVYVTEAERLAIADSGFDFAFEGVAFESLV